jgi:hypothetical protein
MFRRQSWLKPFITSSSERPRSGIWKTYLGCTSPNPAPPSSPCCHPIRRSRSATSNAFGSRDVASTSRSRFTSGFWMPALTAAADHRRITTGGPIFTENAPCRFR